MQIFVKNLSGDGTSHHSPLYQLHLLTPAAIAMTVPPTLSIANLTTLVSVRTSLPESDLRLVFAGKHLSSSPTRSLADCNISKESTLHMAVPLRGGMPPKKIRCTFKECREGAQRIIGDCGFCNGHYCGKHRLLEDHKCDGLEDVSAIPKSLPASKRSEPSWWLVGLDTEDLLADEHAYSARRSRTTATLLSSIPSART